MTAKNIINYMIPPLKPEDSVSKAQRWMDELKTSELPVTTGDKFLGIVSENMTHDQMNAEVVGDLILSGQECVIHENNHYYEVLSLSYKKGVRLVAVLDTNDKYLGVVSIGDVVEAFAQVSSAHFSGAIIVLEVEEKDYSLSQISRIIEMNDAKILSSYVAPIPEKSDSYRITLKLNVEDIFQIKTTLENSNIKIDATFNTAALSYEEKERLNLFMKYLNP